VVSHLAVFFGVSALVIVTPGQDTALTVRNTLLRGRSGGVATAGGVALGQAVWALAAAAGAAALLRASAPAFLAVRLAGAAYLVVLGAQALRAALRGGAQRGHAARSRGRPLRQGLLSNLGNPKMAVFFTSLLPQFAGSFPALLALGLVFSGMTLAWLTGYAIVVARARNVLARPRVRRALDAATGAALVAFGLRLATERS
jgi:threonine/homoserine/homoserine lactone efflux protein